MNSKDVLEYIMNLNKYINDNTEIVRMEIDIDLIHTLEQIQKDLEILDLFKKYFIGVSQEKETGRWFIDMSELDGADLAVFLKLCKE